MIGGSNPSLRAKIGVDMNICKNCGKEIPDTKRNNVFCCKSCSATYNNRRRARKKWDHQQRARFSDKNRKNDLHVGYKQYKCKYCGKITDSRICKECKPFVYRLNTYKKFGIYDGPLSSRNEKLRDLIYDEYFVNKKSSVVIEAEYGISNQSILNILNREFGSTRNLSEGISLAIKEGRLLLPRKSNLYKTGVHESWEGNIYYYRSSWEESYMKWLDERKVKYLYEPFRIDYLDTLKNEIKIAIPDFYLPDSNEIIEIKSLYTLGNIQIMKDKFLAYQKMGYVPRLLLDWKFYNFDELKII